MTLPAALDVTTAARKENWAGVNERWRQNTIKVKSLQWVRSHSSWSVKCCWLVEQLWQKRILPFNGKEMNPFVLRFAGDTIKNNLRTMKMWSIVDNQGHLFYHTLDGHRRVLLKSHRQLCLSEGLRKSFLPSASNSSSLCDRSSLRLFLGLMGITVFSAL